MKNTIKTLAFTVLVLSSIAAKAQQQPNFLFFEQNMSLFNPAYTGSEGSLAGLQYRSAWSGIEDAPRAASFIYHTKEKNKASWGVSYLSDRVYVENQGIVAVDYSYKLTLGSNTNLYLGIKAGVVYNNLDAAGLDRITQESNANLNSIQNYMNPLVGIGLLLKGEKYFIGLSTPNMLNSKRYKEAEGSSYYSYRQASFIHHRWLSFKAEQYHYTQPFYALQNGGRCAQSAYSYSQAHFKRETKSRGRCE